MAIINSGSLALQSTFSDNATTLLSNALHVASYELNGTTFVYVSSENGDAIEIFTLSEAGVLTNVGQVTDSGGVALNRAWDMRAFDVNGTPFLAVTAATDDGITLFSLTDTVPYLTFADSVFQTEDVDYNLDRAYGIEVVTTSSGTFLYAAGYVSNGISSFEVASNGTLIPLANIDDDATLDIAGAIDISHFTRNGNNYVAVAGYDEDGLSVFFVNNSGSLSEIASLSGLQAADGVWEIDSVGIGANTFFYLPGTNASGISVVQFNGNILTEVQSIISSTGLDGVRASEVIDLGDRKYLAIMEEFGAELQLFEIETNSLTGQQGHLTPLQTVTGPTFNASGDVKTVVIAGKPFLIAASGSSGYINVLEIGGGDDLLEGTQDDDQITGGGGDDIIYGFAGDDLIDGGDDTDIIYAGSGLDTVVAGLGNDQTFGGSGFDRFDATSFSNNTIGNGVTVDLFNQKFILPGGALQFVTDFERVDATNFADALIGNEKTNDLRGGSGNDTLRGREGDDFLRGQNGQDSILGGDGNDLVLGGFGDDFINGGAGDDTIEGEDGADLIFGGLGNDSLRGEDGNDTIRGNEGNDSIAGSAFAGSSNGASDLRGGDGNDTISGGASDDYISGDADDDFIFGYAGDDTMLGGSGDDIFFFSEVAGGGGGFNTIKDFTNGDDQFALLDYTLTFTEIQDRMTQRSWGTRLDLDDGQVIAFEGFNKIDFDAGDLFVSS